MVLETSSNSSKPGFPVALGTGCEGKSISSLDVCRQVKCHSMYLFHYFKKNSLTPKSDSHLISPYNITPESHFKVMRIKEMITN